jgi:N-acetylmuramoyl-L-alanine amidase
MSKTIFLDAGHGGVSPSGKYTTAPSKMSEHIGHTMHYRSFFYEGVKNRHYCDIIYKKLVERGVNVVKVYHSYKDTTLGQRVREANSYHKNINTGFYFSEHSNAFNGKARGYCVYTSKGNTQSDFYAEKLINMYKEKFPFVNLRVDNSDQDQDWESNFYVLKNTSMPAILTENLFFDNLDDANILLDEDYVEQYTDMCVEFLESVAKE